ncbi:MULTISPECIES: 3'-5' exonuclease [unclassified Agarivorans]|uniref:3'-5' exonuclease n=1 Tax=unclassified Agarivorans TaxID=2636026 RepID=UPI0010F154B9|nr:MULTISPECIES: 3'-5' exonuclease [unclassified Agarivorans]MDO6686759.1 3'-5' exonuclease [Agarivorans sp. 3_MG-2023]MDO6716511.1 3'-5' exonuclease [Agarivorans sp. 2_MG-2023]MDO6765466.1 3'-5' exonuclease [Agarivorans sp. 1_MG-2023]GDY26707.1 3'-5' exonuclease [Agarivorans sp. Toyoura001]
MLQRLLYQRKYRDSPFATLFQYYRGPEFVALDLETTSLDTKQADIVSIGAVIIREQRILSSQCFDVKVRSTEKLAADSIKIHRLRHSDLEQASQLEEALPKLLDFIGPRPIVGYNIAYDQRILNRFCRQLYGFKLVNPLIDVGRMFADKVHVDHVGISPNLDLVHICQTLGIPLSGRHQAIDDAITAAMIYLRLQFGPRPTHAIPQAISA